MSASPAGARIGSAPLHAFVVIGRPMDRRPDFHKLEPLLGRGLEKRERFARVDPVDVEPGRESVGLEDRRHAVVKPA